tara:strand:+ start:1530 stop:2351 length:822 start_codon:yes stop_codon:yes gene_type:complete
MPATSKAQQRLMGLVKAVQAGEVPKAKVTKKIRQLAKSMKKKDVDKYAGTKHKDLPNKVQSENLKVDVARKYGPKGFIIMLNKFGNTATKIFRDKKDFDKLNINLSKQSDLKKLLYIKTDRVGFVIDEGKGPCWSGYKQVGMKKGKKGNRVPNCVPEVAEHCGCEHKDTYDVFSEETGIGYTLSFCRDKKLQEAEYQGRKVKLNKPMQGDTAKFKVYVKNDKGNVVKVNFGAKGKKNRIKKSDPARRRSFRARHNCDNPGPKYKARYWSCRKW